MRTLERVLALTAMMAVGQAWGFGLNNLYGIQTIGSPFYAEIPIQSAPTVSRQCISVKPLPGETDTFIADLQADVAGPPNAQRLIISSRSTVRGPLISFVVAVNCPEASMTREYTVLAEGPSGRLPTKRDSVVPMDSRSALAAPVAVVSSPVVSAPAGGGSDNTVVIPAATTLNAMARVLYPNDRAARDAYRAAFAAANPSLFAGVKSVGSVMLAAGTVLQVPAAMPIPTKMPAADPAPANPPEPKPAASKRPPKTRSAAASGAALPSGQRDRLTIGVATPQLQMLADAITRIEGMAAERDKVQSELVGGVSGSLNAVIELKNRLAAQEVQMRQLIELQIESERRRAREKESEIGLVGLLALLLSAMALTAGLVVLHHVLATRRQALILAQMPQSSAAIEADTVTVSPAQPPPTPVAQHVVAAEPVSSPVAPAAPPAVVVPPSQAEPPPPAPLEPPPVMEYVPESATAYAAHALAQATKEHEPEEPVYPKIEYTGAASSPGLPELPEAPPIEAPAAEPDFLLPSLLEKEIAELTELMRQSDDLDPARCLKLLQQARATGLMTRQETQALVTEFRRIFNADVLHQNDTRTLDAFPRVLGAIGKSWNGPEGVKFLTSLIFDDRGGEREGFPEPAFEEILLLKEVLKTRIEMYGEDQTALSTTAPPALSVEFILPETPST